jgi:hypothetical protein
VNILQIEAKFYYRCRGNNYAITGHIAPFDETDPLFNASDPNVNNFPDCIRIKYFPMGPKLTLLHVS